MTTGLPVITYASLVQLCDGAAPSLPYYMPKGPVVFCYVPLTCSFIELGEAQAWVARQWPHAQNQWVFVMAAPEDRATAAQEGAHA